MRSRHVLLRPFSPEGALLGLLVVSLLGPRVLAVCPSMCSCSRSHREVDCSSRGLRQLPDGLQYNMRALNLSHNRFQNLDEQLTMYTHVRVLDLSHNRLSRLPAGLPRSLWQLHAASNRLQLLDKNDTVYQWNLRMLDLSNNKLERATFINNTLINLCTLNLSRNHFWTLPTNMPLHLEAIDLSHNLLVKVLPGSLDRLPRLTHFYLHANRFSTLPVGVLDKMTSLRVITLGSNPWACHLYGDIDYLLSWTQQTLAHVLGCPCHTQSVCGGVRPGRTGGWHHASYNLPPLSSMPPGASVGGWWYSHTTATPRNKGTHRTIHQLYASPAATGHMLRTDSRLFPDTDEDSPTDSPGATDTSSFSDSRVVTETATGADMALSTDRFFATESPFEQTKKTTTLRTRSVRRQNQSRPRGIGNSCPAPAACWRLPLLHSLGLLLLVPQHVL
ncbi:putative oligodendrocyte-myelin glycoprotein-like [Scophthalmus maximus]|uniref:Putative oligodendrocyte-myelin glycoprotein-like n=1 Tax=Scophthalmus maximus TaxID=52904 RepID=A0A2U9B907_SCOMX|nr:putative oligodendrocyte-myelin glycoprotein-like [Scophthalmus maximus]